MNTSIVVCFIIHVALISIASGEIEFCVKFGSKYGSKNSVDSKETPLLLTEANEELQNTIEQLKSGSGLAWNYTDFHLNIAHAAITLEGNFTNGSIVIDEPILQQLTFISGGLEIFNLTFPNIYINGSYDLSGYVGANRLFDIYGNGSFDLQLFNFSMAAVSSLKIEGTALCIPISVNLYVKDFKNNFHNLMNGDEELEPLINGVMQAIVPDVIRIFFREDADFVDTYIQWVIDHILNLGKLQSLSRLLYLVSSNTDQLN